MNIKTTFFLFILNSYFILKLTKSNQIRLKFEKKRNRNLDLSRLLHKLFLSKSNYWAKYKLMYMVR